MDIKQGIYVLLVAFFALDFVDAASADASNERSRSDRRKYFRKNLQKSLKERKFLKKVERRLKSGKPLFSDKAIKMLENGWKILPLPHQKNNRAFGLCDIRQEFDVQRMFPGLFRTTDDIYNLPEMHSKTNRKINKIGDRPRLLPMIPSKVGAANRIRIPTEIDAGQRWTGNTPLRGLNPPLQAATAAAAAAARTVNRSTNSFMPQQNSKFPFICDCCKTDRYFEAYDNITLKNTTYRVISLPSAKQFYATERCPEKPKCMFGGCIQRYTTHFILIWNGTKPYYPALDFTPVEVPSHCEWANIGV